ncbi:MAG: Gx transporter family protein [Nitrospirae bacterium]|nr:Gx transporter family protein [Nitrospirota bacterium]
MLLQDKYRIAVLSAYALVLHGFEAVLPMPVPWLKLGLANIITVVALFLFDFRTAFTVTLIRVILSSMFTGTFLGPSFVLSLGGGAGSTLAAGFFHYSLISISGRPFFGAVGLSLISSFFHNVCQLTLAYFIFIQRIEAILIISPFVLLVGTATGLINGIIADILIRNVRAPLPESDLAGSGNKL